MNAEHGDTPNLEITDHPIIPWARVTSRKGIFQNTRGISVPQVLCTCDDEDCINTAVASTDNERNSMHVTNPNHAGRGQSRVHIDSGAVDTVGPQNTGRAFK